MLVFYHLYRYLILIASLTPAVQTVTLPEQIYTGILISNFWLVGIALLIEWPFIKWITHYSWLKSLFPLLLANLVSSMAAYYGFWVMGKGVNLGFLPAYEHLTTHYGPAVGQDLQVIIWILSPPIVILFTTIVEFAALKLCLSSHVQWNPWHFCIHCLVQALTVGLIILAAVMGWVHWPMG